MKAICFYFQIHQPFRLKKYRFQDIGNDSYYYDDFNNDEIITNVAQKSYLPANAMLKELIESSNKRFKVAFSITGTALEQLEQYVPEFIDSMKELVATGCVEFLAETYAHSLSSLTDTDEFILQVKNHSRKIKQLFGVEPKVLRNTELIFSDDIAAIVSSMGYKGMITEGAKHILGWKSPNYVYSAAAAPGLKLLLNNSKLSNDISLRFNNHEWHEYPLTADKYMNWIASLPQEEQLVNLFMNYETFGEYQDGYTGIFDFMRALPYFAQENGISFITPSEAIAKHKSVGELAVPSPMSWADEARDVSSWLGNKLQNEAFEKLYAIAERVRLCTDRRIKQDWNYLQASDHFFYMRTKQSYNDARSYYSPYETPYDAFTNYMNALSDFIVRVEAQYPLSIDNEELNALLTTIRNQAKEIEMLKKEVEILRNNINNAEANHHAATAPKAKATATAKKPAAPKAATPAKKRTVTKKTTTPAK